MSAFWVGETLEQMIAGIRMAIWKNYSDIYVRAIFKEAPSITKTQWILSIKASYSGLTFEN